MSRRKASELSKEELVGMIAHLRGVLYGVLFTPDDVEDSELEVVLEATSFDNDLSDAFVDPPDPARLRRLADGRCPTHGLGLCQSGLAFEDGEPVGDLVECPRQDCDFEVEVRPGSALWRAIRGER